MLDDRFLAFDQTMSRRVEVIYTDPKRHSFYSCFEQDEAVDERGPRGGKIRGRKTFCAYCGLKKFGHADVTEAL